MRAESKWDRDLEMVEFYLNTAENATIKTTPFQAVYGYPAVYQDALLDTLTTLETNYKEPSEVHRAVK